MTNNVTDTVQITESSCCGCETPIINEIREGDVTISFSLDMPDGTTVRYGIYTTKITNGKGLIELNEPIKEGEVQIQVDEENCQALAYKNVIPNFFLEENECTLKVIDFQTEIIAGIGKILVFRTDIPDVLSRLDNGEWGNWENFELELGKNYNIGIKSKISLNCRINFPVTLVQKEIKVPYGVPSSTPALLQVPNAVPTIQFTPVSYLIPVNVPTPVSVPIGVAVPTPVTLIDLLPFAVPTNTPTPTSVLTPVCVPNSVPTPISTPLGVPTPVTTPVGVPTPIFCEPVPAPTAFNLYTTWNVSGIPTYFQVSGQTLGQAETFKNLPSGNPSITASGHVTAKGNNVIGEVLYNNNYAGFYEGCFTIKTGFYAIRYGVTDKIAEIQNGVLIQIIP